MVEEKAILISSIGASIATSVIGQWDISLQILIILVVVDYITGFVKSYINNELSSKTGAKGILKKILIFIIVVVANQVDILLNMAPIIRGSVCFFYCANEALSILENVTDSGIPIPKFIKQTLLQIKENNNDKDIKK